MRHCERACVCVTCFCGAVAEPGSISCDDAYVQLRGQSADVLLGVILHRQSQIIDRWYAAANVQCVVASRCGRVCECVGARVCAYVCVKGTLSSPRKGSRSSNKMDSAWLSLIFCPESRALRMLKHSDTTTSSPPSNIT